MKKNYLLIMILAVAMIAVAAFTGCGSPKSEVTDTATAVSEAEDTPAAVLYWTDRNHWSERRSPAKCRKQGRWF